ncbi:MAG: transglutaminase domain-containing protein [Burkholderiales bacterium]
MKFLKSKLAAFLTDMFCCILLGASVCSIFLPSAGFAVGYGDCILLTMACLGLIVLFTRKLWVFPALAGAVLVLTLLISTILDLHRELWEYIDGFVRWCAASYPPTAPYSTNGSIIVVEIAAAFPAAAISYLYFRKLFFFPALPPAALGLLIWAHSVNFPAFWPVFYMLLAVVFLSIAKATGNRINKKLPKEDGISSALLVMTAIVIVPVVIFLSVVISPKNDGEWQSKGLFNMVEDISDYFGWGDSSDPVQGSFNIGVSGFSPLENRLGGNVTPSNEVVMTVITNSPMRLKGAVYDAYDGQRWYDTAKLRRFRLTSSIWQNMRDEVFGLPNTAGSEAKKLLDKLTHSAKLSITYSERGRTLFSAGRLQSIESRTMDISGVFFNRQSELFTSVSHRSMRYVVNTVIFNRNLEDFDANMTALESLTENEPDGSWDGICSEYLQLPDSLPNSVYETAAQITRGCKTPYEKAKAIENWLAKNCRYTLTPGIPPENMDFVEYFLQKREGYCVYFASAMTVLARAEGLPARFVTGYALKRNPATTAGNSFLATNATAHAWTEIYFKGIGWLTFDASGWNFDENAVIDQNTPGGQVASPTPAPTPDVLSENDADAANGGGMSAEFKATLVAVTCIAVALGLFMAVRVFLLTGSGYYRRLCRKYPTAGERLSACYAKILRQVSFLGLRQETCDTITSFARRVDEYLRSEEMTAACIPVIKMRFRLEEPSDADVEKMCEFSASLEKRLREHLGLSVYLWRRILLGR